MPARSRAAPMPRYAAMWRSAGAEGGERYGAAVAQRHGCAFALFRLLRAPPADFIFFTLFESAITA